MAIWLVSRYPKQVAFGTIPKTSTGKIQKYILRQQAQSALDRLNPLGVPGRVARARQANDE